MLDAGDTTTICGRQYDALCTAIVPSMSRDFFCSVLTVLYIISAFGQRGPGVSRMASDSGIYMRTR